MRALRDAINMAQGCGLTVLHQEVNGHIKLRVRAPDGREGLQVFSKTPSDGRTLQNKRSELRRFAKGVS
jgi:hypothetical protein